MTHTVADIAARLEAQVFGDGAIVVKHLSEPQTATVGDLALAMSPRYADALLANPDVEVAVVWQGADWAALGLKAAIVVGRPRLTMAGLTQAFDPSVELAVISPLADVSDGAIIGAGVTIGAFVSVASGAVIGAGSILHPGVRIGRNVTLGARVICQPNVVVGGDGFSFVTADPSHPETGRKTLGKKPFQPMDGTLHRIHSLGGVVIGDDVEIGANSTVDAGTIRPTTIGSGTKIDNLVQVGHNVQIGRDSVLCAQAAVAGSTNIGDRVVLGGKSGVADNVTVGSDVVLGGAAIALTNIDAGSFMMGYPAVPMLTYRAQQRKLRQTAEIHKPVSISGQSD